MQKYAIWTRVVVIALTCLLIAEVTPAQGPDMGGQVDEPTIEPLNPEEQISSGFTYQGYLEKDGSPVNGTCNFQVSLWDAATNGTQVGPTFSKGAIHVS